MCGVMAHRARLLYRPFCSRNDVLFLGGFNPKTRWKIRQIRDDGGKGPPGINTRPAFTNLPVEMWDHRNKKVCGIFAPKVFEQIHKRAVKETNGRLQHAKKILA